MLSLVPVHLPTGSSRVILEKNARSSMHVSSVSGLLRSYYCPLVWLIISHTRRVIPACRIHFPRARVPQLPMQVRVHGLPPGPATRTLPPGVRQLRLSLEVRINGLPPGPPCRTLPPGVREPQQPLRGGVYGIPPR
ncbi:homeobox protein ESX1-like [Homalodisca vitripennis]|uniref:homeobox protein ESX1-like n=1 Tax=Homalodisca vitripennis TaxID=197043 RepID=UPI001EECB39D|nr:homeobox protein ESX1-like [Homalodisca vitripennis]